MTCSMFFLQTIVIICGDVIGDDGDDGISNSISVSVSTATKFEGSNCAFNCHLESP